VFRRPTEDLNNRDAAEIAFLMRVIEQLADDRPLPWPVPAITPTG
jgi:hypothetical protein